MNRRLAQILELRMARMTYADIGARVGLTKERVRQLLIAHAPHLVGPGHVGPRPSQKYANAPSPKKDIRAYHRWYYLNVTKARPNTASKTEG